MASSSLSSPSAPTFSSRLWKYHVFVSFTEDTYKPFVANLYTALEKKGICTYKDDTTHPRDESVGPSLEAIKESHIAIIVFSENYADSSWCLEELSYIMKIKDTRGQIVMPIFYDVDASAVRKQKRKYGEAFAKHEVANKKKVESWRKALEDASNLSRWNENIAKGHESEGINQIVDMISQMLHLVTSSANENLIGIEARIQDLKSKLEIGSGGVRMVGVWGVGGGGKTTLASSVYDEICSEFDGCCFVKNIRAESSRYGLGKLQEYILSGILKEKQVQVIQRVEEGRRKIMGSLCRRKVLIVLDDVDHPDQLEALAGSHDWFGEGSRIIITARDAHLLATRRVVVMHNISLLNEDEAIELFRKYGADYIPMEYYELLSKDVVSYAGGLPLALRVLGCFLCDKEIDVWRSALARLKEIPNDNIMEKLKISFNGLKPVEKELFLDIACFFRREDKDKAMEILGACCFDPLLGVKVLIQKDLIAITDGMFDMHNLVQEMGHDIVQGEHPENPEKHSRVWKKEDVAKICTMDVTTELDMIEAIRLKCNGVDALQHLPLIVANMKRLRWIDWEGDLASPLPINFSPVELCCLKLDGISQKVLWEGFKYLPHLRMLELYGLNNLIMTPYFDGLPRLQRLKIAKCWYLEEIHPSIGCMKMLIFLSIEFCFGLKMFPRLTGLKKLETLTFSRCPKLFKLSEIQQQNMKHIGLQFSHVGLRKLDLMYCDLGDEDIGSAVWELPNVENLNVTGNKFSGLDFSLLRLPQLKWLNISYCGRLVKLSELPSSIAVLIADHCTSLETFGDVSNCKLLWKVSLRGVNKLGPLGGDILLHSMIQENTTEDRFISVTLENQNPEGFVGRLYRGKTFTLHLPDDWYNEFCGFLICLVTNTKSPQINITIKQEADEEDSRFELWQEEYTEAVEPEYDGTTTFVGYIPFNSLRNTTLLTSSYNIISFSIEDMFSGLNTAESHVCAELIPRKSKDDQAHTTDYSKICAKELEYGNTFTIKHNSKSSIKIQWFPYNNRNTEVKGLDQVSSRKRVRKHEIIVQTTSEVDDGYIWRKYGKKDILRYAYPRSNYKCASQGCNVRKHVERAASNPNAVITTYEGKHNHDVPAAKNSNHNMANNAMTTTTQQPNHGGDSEISFLDVVSSHRTVTEPQVSFQTTSEADLPDDGYIWSKYGLKNILGNPHPRFYYRCISRRQGCKALKQVERFASDPKVVKTTYFGIHNHDVPEAKNSSHNMANTARTTTTQPPNHSGDCKTSFLDEVSSHRTVTEPQIMVQTTIESDLSDDGYIWSGDELEF